MSLSYPESASTPSDNYETPAIDCIEAKCFSPTMLFGMERSGTTLLSMMVGAHPQIAVPLSVTGMWYRFFSRLPYDYNNIVNKNDVTRLVEDVLSHERIQMWNTTLAPDRILANIRPGDFGSVVSSVHAEYARQNGKPYWANIDIATLDSIHIANGWFSNVRFIHIVRDGRDVALSHQKVPFGAGNLAECTQSWSRRVTQNLRIGAVIGKARYLTIQYEDLILKPETELQRICSFLRVPYSTKMLNYRTTVEKTIPENKRWMWPEIKKPPQRSRVGVWEKRMSPAQKTVCEWNAGELLQELGYKTDSVRNKRPMAYLLELWYFLGHGHRWARIKKRIRVKYQPHEATK